MGGAGSEVMIHFPNVTPWLAARHSKYYDADDGSIGDRSNAVARNIIEEVRIVAS